MKLFRAAAAFAAVVGASVRPTPAVVQTEHGWKTRRVVATRHRGDFVAYFITFTFPLNPYDCDRSEIFEFIEANGGNLFEGGGMPGAPIRATFRGVTDKASAGKKLVELLPKFDALMNDIANGVEIPKPQPRKIVDKHGKEWPECIPPDPADRFGEINNNLSVNGTQYKCSAGGRWVVDETAMQWKQKYANERAELLVALTQRKMTHVELLRIDSSLNVGEWQSYFPAVKYAELYDSLVRQYELQTGADLPVKTPLSRALGEYNRAPQEGDNRRAVEQMIAALQKISEGAR